LTSFQF